MSYMKTKLSYEDKDILQEIYEELEEINITTTFKTKGGTHHAIKTGTTFQKDARQTIFGYVNHKGKKKLSVYSKKYPYIMPLFKEFMKSHYPSFKFKSVYVNKNTISKKHLDSKNAGESLLVGFGRYTGGKTVIYINDKPKKFQIKLNSLIFNGSEILHYSEPFKGIRYSLVFFK
jgi:hypothetical protein